MITATMRGVEASLDRLERAVDRAMLAAVEAISRRVAEEAISGHSFTNRTGDLEGAIRPVDANIDSGGIVIGGVTADTDYAQFVDAMPGFAFLEPAFDRVEPEADRLLEQALEEAARASGF